jgi:bromodomain-containing factor 1
LNSNQDEEMKEVEPPQEIETKMEVEPTKQEEVKLEEEEEEEEVKIEEISTSVQTEKKKRPGRPKKKTTTTDEYAPPPNVVTKTTTPTVTRTKKEKEKEERPQRPRKAPKPIYEPHVASELKLLSDPLQQCYKILELVVSHQYSWPFLQPVDPTALNLPDYFNIIKNPMDLSTARSKLLGGKYETIQQFSGDIRLIWQNCFTYNPPNTDIVKMAQELDQFFEQKIKKVVDESMELLSLTF